MMNLEKDILCVLLQTLKDDNLITQDVHDQAKEKVLCTLDGPDFFCYAEDDGKEDLDGST